MRDYCVKCVIIMRVNRMRDFRKRFYEMQPREKRLPHRLIYIHASLVVPIVLQLRPGFGADAGYGIRDIRTTCTWPSLVLVKINLRGKAAVRSIVTLIRAEFTQIIS